MRKLCLNRLHAFLPFRLLAQISRLIHPTFLHAAFAPARSNSSYLLRKKHSLNETPNNVHPSRSISFPRQKFCGCVRKTSGGEKAFYSHEAQTIFLTGDDNMAYDFASFGPGSPSASARGGRARRPQAEYAPGTNVYSFNTFLLLDRSVKI